MPFPEYRGFRHRARKELYQLLSESLSTINDCIYPLYLSDELASKPLCDDLDLATTPIDDLKNVIDALKARGIKAVMLYPAINERDELARHAVKNDNLIAKGIKEIRRFNREIVIFSDVDLSPYTLDGSSGIKDKGHVDLDATLEVIAEMALVQARAGSEFLVLSGGVDGQVGFVREALDEENFEHVGLVGRLKLVSTGVFQNAVDQSKREYFNCLDPMNSRDILNEAELISGENADFIALEPSGMHLDLLRMLYDELPLPLIALPGIHELIGLYTAAKKGWGDYHRLVKEWLNAQKRAGAELIVSTAFVHELKTKKK